MTWLQRYRLRNYVRNSMVVLPLLGIVAALGLVRLDHWIDQAMGWESNFSPEAARAIVGTMASSMFTFIVFLSSMLLLALQLASAQMTPRIIASVFRDPVTKFSLAVFVFTFTFSLASLARIGETVPYITSHLAIWSSILSLFVFFYLVGHIGKSLRPSGALKSIGEQGRKVIESIYPHRLDEWQAEAVEPTNFAGEQPTRTIINRKDGVVLAFDLRGLVSLAERSDCIIEMVPQVGDFVAAEDLLFRIYCGGADLSEDKFHQSVAFDQERTLEQDPAFAFRIIVDIASKGLSPAINDPTTAVLAIDQIHHLLRKTGNRHLDEGRVCDKSGQVRLVYPTPDWEDFVHLAVTEIRHFGGHSIQVARRLRAMLENLIQTLPEERAPLLRQELQVLQRTAGRLFPEPEDRALADISDSQGIGGKEGRSQSQQRTSIWSKVRA